MKVVSVGLWGDSPSYAAGAIRLARMMPEFYPGWELFVYHEDGHPAWEALHQLGAWTLPRGYAQGPNGWRGNLWRLNALIRDEVEVAVFRDVDSVPTDKERQAVNAWLASNKRCHAMHDHPEHRHFPLMGGMWGLKGGLPNVYELLDQWEDEPNQFKPWWESLGDEVFLMKKVWPLVKDSCLRHSSVPVPWPYEPFPSHRPADTFIGQQA